MLIAEEIAKKTKLNINVVRYRLSVLRRRKAIEFTKCGQTYVYTGNVIKQVKNYEAYV